MAILLAYNLATDFAPSTTASGVTGGTVTNSLLSSLTQGSAGYASDNVSSANPASGATSASLAVSAGSYFFFSITPAAGKKISLTTLTFNAARGGGATPRGYDVRSSQDEFAATLQTADLLTQRTTWTAVSVDLSAAAFQDQSGTITFNIYIYAPSTVNAVDWDDLVVNGTVADGGTLEQEGFRFRADDGSQTTATWLTAQDTNVIRQKSTNTRLRVVLNSTLDRGAETYQLEYRKVGDTTWNVMT